MVRQPQLNAHRRILGAIYQPRSFAMKKVFAVLLLCAVTAPAFAGEDSERVAKFVKKGLVEAGHTVDYADNGRDGMFLAASEPCDVIVMDRMLPGSIDGLGIIAALRKSGSKVPILILSALSDVDERIRGLQSGGDDYLVKPFAFGELLARLDALVRRAQDASAETTLALEDLNVDLLSRKVTRAGKPVALQPREFKLLEYLMR